MTDELNALAGAYVLDALDDDERAFFEAHLQTCEDCSEEVAGLRNAAAELSHIEAVAPPEFLRGNVLASISRVRPLPPESGSVIHLSSRRRSRFLVQLASAACVLLALIAVGWGVQQHRAAGRADGRANTVQQALDAPDAIAKTGPLGDSSGIVATVVYSKLHGTMLLSAHGITALPTDKTYQAWTLTTGGAATSLGTFKPDSNGVVTMLAKSDVSGAAYLGVTVEPAGGSKTPTGVPLTLQL